MERITTQRDLRAAFWRAHASFAAERRPGRRQNDYRADIRMAWCDFIDGAEQSGAITAALADRATL